MDIKELKKYKVKSIKKDNSMIIFGVPKNVIDEGSIYRIAGMEVINKGLVANCDKKDKTITINMESGETIEIKVF